MDRTPAVGTRPPTDERHRARGIQRATSVAIGTNALLALGQIVIGQFANAFSLVADAAHTLSDLATDILVLLTGRRASRSADHTYPYGPGRLETAATLLLGVILAGVGLGFLWSSGLRLQHMNDAPPLHPAALYMAIFTLAAKEVLFRYTLAAARRLKAPVLEANAWHARSDAASSLVVALGIGGSLAGFPFLEPLAAALVGFLIAGIGLRFVWRSIRELVDTGLSEQELARLRKTIHGTPGVIGLHDLRTRRMADRVLCDAHVQVAPHITVSEGHRISDAVFFRVRAAHPEVRDVLVHIDAEDDASLQSAPPRRLPDRAEIVRELGALLGDDLPPLSRVQIHYLGDRVEAEVLLPPEGVGDRLDSAALEARIEALLAARPEYRAISVFVRLAPR